jgi:aminoglycoside phosphotransferase (APT) family kinase protein
MATPDSLLEVVGCRTVEMIDLGFTRIHGHTLVELEQLLRDACDIFDGDVFLKEQSLGGWSNINILGQSDGLDFVLKLPASVPPYETSLYKRLYTISLFLSKTGATTKPLIVGNLLDDADTPFIIFEYIDGATHQDLTTFSHYEMESLRRSLQVFSQQKPTGLTRYTSAHEYLTSIHEFVGSHVPRSSCSREVDDLLAMFRKISSRVLTYADSLGPWFLGLMHGDLWAPNIVFRKGTAVLLDLESCAYGSRFFDLAYLLEADAKASQDLPEGLVLPEEIEEVNRLRPPAVAYLILWSIERLLSMDAGLIEPILATQRIRSALTDYTRSKISRLSSLLP